MVGDRLFAKILETARKYFPPLGTGRVLSFTEVLEGIREVAVYFFLRGYSLKEPTVTTGKDGQLTVLFVGPATLWGSQALSQLHCIPNEYDVQATTAFIKSAGWWVEGTVTSKATESTLTRTYKVRTVGNGVGD